MPEISVKDGWIVKEIADIVGKGFPARGIPVCRGKNTDLTCVREHPLPAKGAKASHGGFFILLRLSGSQCLRGEHLSFPTPGGRIGWIFRLAYGKIQSHCGLPLQARRSGENHHRHSPGPCHEKNEPAISLHRFTFPDRRCSVVKSPTSRWRFLQTKWNAYQSDLRKNTACGSARE